jgi:hypothetical protein
MMDFVDHDASDLIEPISATFAAETGYLVVNVDKLRYHYLDRPVRWGGRIFNPKSELHITIVSLDAAMVQSRTSADTAFRAQVEERITETDWRFRKLSAFYHVVESPGVETLIQLVEIPAMQGFFQKMSALFGVGFHVPPAHVTLYTLGTEKGIGLPTRAELDELAIRIDPVEIKPASQTGA